MTGERGGVPDSRRPTLLLWSALLFAAAAPWSIAAAQTGAVLFALALAATVLPRGDSGAATRGGAWPPLSGFHWMLLAFLLAQAISIPLGVHPARSLRCFRGSWVLLFGFIFFWGLRDRTIRRLAVAALLGSASLAGLYGLLQHSTGREYFGREALESIAPGRFVAVGTLGSHLTYAGVLLPVALLALGAALRAERHRFGYALAAACCLAGIVVSYTRTAWLGLAAGLVVLGLSLGRRVALALTVVGGAAGVALLSLQPTFARRAWSTFDPDDPRWRLWRTAGAIIREHPWTGAGLGSFKTLFPTFRVPGEYLSTIHPHSDLLNVWVEAGTFGALWLVGLWGAFFVALRGARPHDPTGRGLVAGGGAAVCALLIAGLGQCYFTDEEVAQVWLFVVAVTLHEAHERFRPGHAVSRWFKAATLPVVATLFARRHRGPERTSAPARRWLVLRADNRIGNLLLSRPFLRALRREQPDARVAFLLGDEVEPLARGWEELDERWIQPKRSQARAPWRTLEWLRRLRRAEWDTTVDLSNPGTHSYSASLLAITSGAPERIGFADHRKESALTLSVPAPDPRTPMALAPLALLRARGLSPIAEAPFLEGPIGEPSPAAVGILGALPTPFVLVHLGGRSGKAWPLPAWERFLDRAQRDLPLRVAVVAGPEERARLDALQALGPRVSFVPPMRLSDLTHLAHRAHAFLGCDSGILHLAAALGVPCVGLFFRSDPWRYAPLGAHHRTVLLANPYRVEATTWSEPVDGLLRSRLVTTALDPADSAAGLPAIGGRAQEAVFSAIAAACEERR